MVLALRLVFGGGDWYRCSVEQKRLEDRKPQTPGQMDIDQVLNELDTSA